VVLDLADGVVIVNGFHVRGSEDDERLAKRVQSGREVGNYQDSIVNDDDDVVDGMEWYMYLTCPVQYRGRDGCVPTSLLCVLGDR
jgi:hypothetical protein